MNFFFNPLKFKNENSNDFFNNITTINENSTVENINKYLSLHIYYEDSRNLINFIHFFNVCWTTIVENNALMGFILKKNEQPFLSEAWFVENFGFLCILYYHYSNDETKILNFYQIKQDWETNNFSAKKNGSILTGFIHFMTILVACEPLSNAWIENLFLVKNEKNFTSLWTLVTLNKCVH